MRVYFKMFSIPLIYMMITKSKVYILCIRFMTCFKTKLPGARGALRATVGYNHKVVIICFRVLRPIAAEQDGDSCCSATGRSPWRRQTVGQPPRDTASQPMRNVPRP